MRTDSHGLRFVSFFGAASLSFCVPASDFRSGGFVVFRVSIFFHNFFPRKPSKFHNWTVRES